MCGGPGGRAALTPGGQEGGLCRTAAPPAGPGAPDTGTPGGQLRACRLGVGCVCPCPPPPRRKPAGLASEVLRESSAEPPLSACPHPGPRWAATAPPARKPRCREQPPVATQARLPRGPGLPTSTPCGPHAAARRSGRWVQVGTSPHRHRPLAQRSCPPGLTLTRAPGAGQASPLLPGQAGVTPHSREQGGGRLDSWAGEQSLGPFPGGGGRWECPETLRPLPNTHRSCFLSGEAMGQF